MGGAAYSEAWRQTRVLFEGGAIGDLSDRELLARYTTRPGDPGEAAFAAIVGRHGPMVLRACSAAIGDEHEAHDAFQATFLVLIRRAGSIRVGDSLGPWLHEVARRVSACARSSSARRERHERRAAERSPGSIVGPEVDDLTPTLHEEIGRLPDRFQTAIVLCDLEGLTQEQAASRLGWPLGTVRSRLARGRDRLRSRLARRGFGPLGLAVPAAVSDGAVEAAVRLAAGGPVSSSIQQLSEGGLRAMKMIRLKTLAMLTLAAGVAASGAGVLAARSFDQPQKPEAAPAKEDPVAARPVARPAQPRPAGRSLGQVLVRFSESRERAWAYSPETKAWRTYKTPPGVKVSELGQPSDNQSVTALWLSGKEIGEVAVFDANTGTWMPHPLKTPVQNQIYPLIGARFAIYHAGRYLYGYSAGTGQWSVRDLGEEAAKEASQRQVVGRDIQAIDFGRNIGLVLVYGHYLCSFHGQTGTWDVLVLDKQNPLRSQNNPTSGQAFFVARGEQLITFNSVTGRFEEVDTGEKKDAKP